MLTITPANLADIPALCALLNDLFRLECEFTPDYTAQSRGLTTIIGNPEIGQILLARRVERIVGMVSLLYTVSTALGARTALLEDMIVAASERNQGVGSRLIETAKQTARQQGCQRITLLTDHGNAAAQRFYARHGFSVSGMLPMRLFLSQP
ncbi:MAG: GNAT family N-acetyltransferase [Methylomonas sp.]|jgi:GNAT superfamily N-acetyltransferase